MIQCLRRTAYVALRVPLMFLWRFVELLIFRSAPRTLLQGIDVRIYAAGTVPAALFDKIAAALDIIGEHDPRRFERLRRDLRRIVIADGLGNRAAYLFHSGTCFIQLSHVIDRSSAMIAVSIVHEAVHRRLENAGIRYWPDIQKRIERRCVREEISFVDRLPRASYPGTDALIKQLSRMIPEINRS